jgi:hypothetical protein
MLLMHQVPDGPPVAAPNNLQQQQQQQQEEAAAKDAAMGAAPPAVVQPQADLQGLAALTPLVAQVLQHGAGSQPPMAEDAAPEEGPGELPAVLQGHKQAGMGVAPSVQERQQQQGMRDAPLELKQRQLIAQDPSPSQVGSMRAQQLQCSILWCLPGIYCLPCVTCCNRCLPQPAIQHSCSRVTTSSPRLEMHSQYSRCRIA